MIDLAMAGTMPPPLPPGLGPMILSAVALFIGVMIELARVRGL